MKGILVYATGEQYLNQAYLCALSLKCKSDYPVSIVTTDDIPENISYIFDKIIKTDLPSEYSRFYSYNRSFIYDLSPYDETIVLDTDVLILEDINEIFNQLSDYDLYYPTTAYTHLHDNICHEYYRDICITNELPIVYNAAFYFKKSERNKKYFDMLKDINLNWKRYYLEYCSEDTPVVVSMDTSCGIALKILEIQDYKSNEEIIKIIHMKSGVLGFDEDSWQDYLKVDVLDNMNLIIDGSMQTGIFHYTENNFLSDQLIAKYESYLAHGK